MYPRPSRSPRRSCRRLRRRAGCQNRSCTERNRGTLILYCINNATRQVRCLQVENGVNERSVPVRVVQYEYVQYVLLYISTVRTHLLDELNVLRYCVVRVRARAYVLV